MHILIFLVPTIITIGFFIIFTYHIVKTLKAENWSLKRALCEPIIGKDNEPIMNAAKDKPIYMESSSRLIALVGLTAILAIDLGVAVMIFYCTLAQTSGNLDLETIGLFLVAQAGIFAPYIANQVKTAVVGSKTAGTAELTEGKITQNQ